MALASASLTQYSTKTHSICLQNSIKMALNLSCINTQSSFPLKTRRSDLSRSSSARCMPIAAAAAQSQPYWAAVEADIDRYLRKSIQIQPPETVYGPMHHLTFAAPPTAASALCVAACELVGGDRSQAMAAAAAIHLVHAAARAHELLPLTDGSRPEPAVQHKYGPNVELLTGDGILPFGFELLARSMDPSRKDDPERILRVIIEISRAGGSEGMISGQYREEEIVGGNKSLEFTEYVCRKKYGEMHGCGAACGAILGGAAEEEVQKLRKFGLYAGTLRGMLEKNSPENIEKVIRKLKELALEELDGFDGEKAELMSSLVAEPSLAFAQLEP